MEVYCVCICSTFSLPIYLLTGVLNAPQGAVGWEVTRVLPAAAYGTLSLPSNNAILGHTHGKGAHSRSVPTHSGPWFSSILAAPCAMRHLPLLLQMLFEMYVFRVVFKILCLALFHFFYPLIITPKPGDFSFNIVRGCVGQRRAAQAITSSRCWKAGWAGD